MRLGIFFQGVLGLNSCTDNLSDPNAAIENCLCGLQKTPLVHLAALKGDVDLIQKIRDEKICDLGISSSTGNNALIFAAQSSSPFQVSKLLLESGVKKEQSNLNGITPLHALLSQNSKVNDIDELLNVSSKTRLKTTIIRVKA
jgi:ankyrin repeat protein